MKLIYALSILFLSITTAFGQEKTTLVVGYAVGGTSDVVARLIADKLSEYKQVIVENKPGGSGSVAARTVATATDGNTLLVGINDVVINPHLLKDNLGYNPDDLKPVALIGVVSHALIVPTNSEFNSLSDLVKVLRSGKKLSFASAGSATAGRFAAEYLKINTRANLVHVPYKGAGPALNDVIGGHVDMTFSGIAAVSSQLTSKTIKVLGVSSLKRVQTMPNVPTVAEITGINDFDFNLWVGIFTSKHVSDENNQKLNAEINTLLHDKELVTKLLNVGLEIMPMTSSEFSTFLKRENMRYESIIPQIQP